MQRGPVLAIVVLAGFASYPSIDVARTLAEAQRAALAGVPITVDSDDDDEATKQTATGLLAMFLLTAVAGGMVATLHRHPVIRAGRLPWE